jgi:hypothetical protein
VSVEREARGKVNAHRTGDREVCYLNTINEDTLRVSFPEVEVPLVQEWFEREASIRDSAAPSFRMRSLVRHKPYGT